MNKIRIWGIAPYEGVENMMKNIAESKSDIELTTDTRDLELAVELPERIDDADYDILSAIYLAQNYNVTFAIVGFPSISNFARTICDILPYNIDIYTI